MTANQPWIKHGHKSLIHEAPDGVDNRPKPSAGRIDRNGAEVQLLEGVYTETMGWSMLVRDKNKPLIIDGQGKTVFAAGMSVMDCHNVHFRNIEVHGWAEINDSYPEIGVDTVSFYNCKFLDSHSRNFFMGGHNIRNVRLEKCDFLYNLNGTHNCYLSGGHWDPSYPPVENIEIINCRFGFTPMGRNNLQFNGRFKNVTVRGCRFAHAQLNCTTFIGVQNLEVSGCYGYGCNRGSGIVVYDYASHWAPYYNYFRTQEDIDKFLKTHQPNGNHRYHHNTWVVGPRRFSRDAWHNDDPADGHPAVLINNAVHSGFSFKDPEKGYVTKKFDFPNGPLEFSAELYVTPSDSIFQIYHEHEASRTALASCAGWGTGSKTPTFTGFWPAVVQNAKYGDPHFHVEPQYDFVDLEVTPESKTNFEWWRKTFKTKFDPKGRYTEKGIGWVP